MDVNETVKKTVQVPRFPYLEDLVHVRKAKYLLTECTTTAFLSMAKSESK